MTAPKCPVPWVRGATARAMLVDLAWRLVEREIDLSVAS